MQKTFDVANMQAPAVNVLDIEQPDKYGCRLWGYEPSHSVLSLRITSEDHNIPNRPSDFYLIFDTVKYFEGPFGWKGANFSTTDLGEYARLLQRIQASEKLSQSIDNEYQLSPPVAGRLFVVKTLNFEVKIIANFVMMTTDVPDNP